MRIDSSVQALDEQLLQSLRHYLQVLEKVENTEKSDGAEA